MFGFMFALPAVAAVPEGVTFNGLDEPVHISETFLRQKIGEKIPMTKVMKKILSITLKSADLTLKSGAIHLSFAAEVTLVEKAKRFKIPDKIYKLDLTKFKRARKKFERLEIEASAVGDIVYRNGAFYFKTQALSFDRFESIGAPIPGNYEDLARLGLTKVVTAYLDNRPVYRIPYDFKSQIAKLALERVEVAEGEVILYLSLPQMIGKIIGMGLFFIFVGWVAWKMKVMPC